MSDAAFNTEILPPLLRKGECVGLVAPAGPVAEEVIRQGLQLLWECGIKNVKYSQDICRRENYLAGSDRRRQEELHQLWDDDEVKAILAVRGGYGCARLLAGLNFELVRRKPKILIGFSDLTILLNVIHQRTGLVTFHGPMLSTLVRSGKEGMVAMLNELTVHAHDRLPSKGVEVLRSGQAEGRLIGGNLTCLAQLLGTPYEPHWDRAILLLEEVNEPVYRVDRVLTHLSLAGCLDQVAGVILGEFLDSDSHTVGGLELIWQRVLELIPEQTPVWANFPAGHGRRNILLPIGRHASMDGNDARLRLL